MDNTFKLLMLIHDSNLEQTKSLYVLKTLAVENHYNTYLECKDYYLSFYNYLLIEGIGRLQLSEWKEYEFDNDTSITKYEEFRYGEI